jgi:hypothetical protein
VGGIQAMLKVMPAHHSSGFVQYTCLRALSNMASTVLEQVLIANLGGIEIILAAMSEHRGNENVQEHGCNALNNITQVNMHVQIKAKQLGAAGIVLAALDAFPNNSPIGKAVHNLKKWF